MFPAKDQFTDDSWKVRSPQTVLRTSFQASSVKPAGSFKETCIYNNRTWGAWLRCPHQESQLSRKQGAGSVPQRPPPGIAQVPLSDNPSLGPVLHLPWPRKETSEPVKG